MLSVTCSPSGAVAGTSARIRLPFTSTVTARLRRGMIRRDVDQNDRRRASLRLTAKGRKVYHDIEKFVVRLERELTATLDARELATLRQSLDKIDRQMEDEVRAFDWEKFVK
jgi:hypothetical protein